MSKEKNIYGRTSPEKKIGILILFKYTEENFTMSPEQMAKLHKDFDEIARKWEEHGATAIWYSCPMMNGKFDSFAIFEVDDLAQWVTMAEEQQRYWGRFTKYYEVYIGVNPPYFDEATKDIPYFKALDKQEGELGVEYG